MIIDFSKVSIYVRAGITEYIKKSQLLKSSSSFNCTILDLYNREILGYSCGKNKDAKLVLRAFSTIKHPLHQSSIFHTDRGSEFKNVAID